MIAARFVRSLKLGTVTAAIVTIVAGVTGHARLTAAAAAAHTSVSRELAYGFAGFAVSATIIIFMLLTVFRPRRQSWEGAYTGRGLGPQRRDREQEPAPDRRRGSTW